MPVRKPSWEQLPSAVRSAVERIFGVRVDEADIALGGFGPTAVFLLRGEGGASAVLKATDLARFSYLQPFAEREEKFYQSAAHYVGPHVPACLGTTSVGVWRVLLLEDVGRVTLTPNDPATAESVARELAHMHRSTADVTLPEWAIGGPFWWGTTWRQLERDGVVSQIAALAEHASDAERWLADVIASLQNTAERVLTARFPSCLLHRDVRADNFRIQQGRLKLFDWSATGTGPSEIDAAFFAQTAALDGSTDPERVIAAYRAEHPLDDALLDSVVASIAGHFANQSWRPRLPHYPDLRAHQRRQFKVTLIWAARRLGLPHPEWIHTLRVADESSARTASC